MYKSCFKRIFDIISSGVALIILSPVLFLYSLSGKRTACLTGVVYSNSLWHER